MENELAILGGVGNFGQSFIKSDLFEELQREYDEVYIYDKNTEVSENCGICNRGPLVWENAEKKDIVIASGAWNELYKDCILHGVTPKGIYDIQSHDIKDYHAICLEESNGYANDKYIKLRDVLDRKIEIDSNDFLNGKNLSGCINCISIEISNLCNYANIHPNCPASKVNKKKIMRTSEVSCIINELAEIGYKGIVSFQGYNEPTIDPRLFSFIEYTKKTIPESTILLYTNGYYLDDVMVDEYISAGVGIIVTTAYGNAEYNRLMHLTPNIPYQIFFGNLDNRLGIYDRKDGNGYNNMTCHSWIADVLLSCYGEMALCCLDYKYLYNLGNVFSQGLKSVLDSDEIRRILTELLSGNRGVMPICNKCGWAR